MLGNVCRPPGFRRRSGSTKHYHISSILGTTPWWFWFGLVGDYQSLPHRTCPQDGSFGLVRSPFTNPYQAADLGAGLPCVTFTNLYHRGQGLHIELSMVDTVAGWHRVIAVDNSGEWRTHSEMGRHHGGRHRKEKKF